MPSREKLKSKGVKVDVINGGVTNKQLNFHDQNGPIVQFIRGLFIPGRLELRSRVVQGDRLQVCWVPLIGEHQNTPVGARLKLTSCAR